VADLSVMRVAESTMREGTISFAEEPQRDSAAETQRNRPSSEEGPSPFARILRGLGREMDRGEHLVSSAIQGGASGHDLGGGQLLALQAGVYRYSEAVDLSAKLVDRAASGVKTVLQGQ
jgi:hypothetical protein